MGPLDAPDAAAASSLRAHTFPSEAMQVCTRSFVCLLRALACLCRGYGRRRRRRFGRFRLAGRLLSLLLSSSRLLVVVVVLVVRARRLRARVCD